MDVFNPHDKFFKETFSIKENVVDFLSGTFPREILKKLDLSTLAQDNNSYIDEELKEHFSDIVYTCFCKGKELRIALLFEHKSYVAPYPHIQLLRYLQITMLLMRNINDETVLEDRLKGFFEIGRQYFEEEEGVKFLKSAIRYLYDASDIAEERVIDTLKEISEEGGEISMTIATRLIEKGKMAGREEGRVEGRVEGRMEGEIEGEKKGRIEGKREGLKEAIEIGLELKYGIEGLKLLERIGKIAVIEKLEAIKEAVKISKNVEEIEKLL